MGKQKERKFRFIVMNSIRVLLVLALLVGVNSGRDLVMVIAVLGLLVSFVPSGLERFFGVKLPAAFEVLVLGFIYGILFLGEVRGLFVGVWWWDVLLNFIAAVVLGFVGMSVLYVLYNDRKIEGGPFIIGVLTFCFALAVVGLWEIFEFVLDSWFGFSLQSGGLEDTMTDLVVGALGALFVSVLSFVNLRRGQVNIVSSLVSGTVKRHKRIFGLRDSLERSSEEIERIIRKGEGPNVEFKSSLRVNLHTGEIDKNIEYASLKTLVAYLNSSGGTLLVGVSDSGKVLGLEKDGFKDNDHLGLHFTNLVKSHIGNEFLPFINFELFPVHDKHVLKVDCRKSKKQVFLKKGDMEEFYVRNGPASVKLQGSALVDYVRGRFRH